VCEKRGIERKHDKNNVNDCRGFAFVVVVVVDDVVVGAQNCAN